jgi:hypothetical protein
LHEAPQRRRPVAVDPARAALPHRADAQRKPGSWFALPSLFGLAPCGVYPAPPFTGRAVRSYRTISPLPRRWRRTLNKFSRKLQGRPPSHPKKRRGVAEAVSFLWHWPSADLEVRIPDVIRHTALRSSDFPPPATRACAQAPAATARSSCQWLVYRETSESTGPAEPSTPERAKFAVGSIVTAQRSYPLLPAKSRSSP